MQAWQNNQSKMIGKNSPHEAVVAECLTDNSKIWLCTLTSSFFLIFLWIFTMTYFEFLYIHINPPISIIQPVVTRIPLISKNRQGLKIIASIKMYILLIYIRFLYSILNIINQEKYLMFIFWGLASFFFFFF